MVAQVRSIVGWTEAFCTESGLFAVSVRHMLSKVGDRPRTLTTPGLSLLMGAGSGSGAPEKKQG
jgi:hypothetical protein